LFFVRLLPIEREAMCGVYKGRMYQRMVAPSVDVSSQSGRCLSVNWFSKEPGYECPLRDSCGAYQRPVHPDEFTKLKPA
jgi:hypothetical protein